MLSKLIETIRLALGTALKVLQYLHYNFAKNVSGKFCYIITVAFHLMSLDRSSLKIDLESIIESKMLLIINSEFWDRFRTLVCSRGSVGMHNIPKAKACVITENVDTFCCMLHNSNEHYLEKIFKIFL